MSSQALCWGGVWAPLVRMVTGGRVSAHGLTAGLAGWRGGQGLPSPSPLDGWAPPEDMLT